MIQCRLWGRLLVLGALLLVSDVLRGVERAADAAGWKDVMTEQLGGLKITLSQPVLVARRSGYLWFPTLTRLENGDLLAVMSNYHDDHVAASTAAQCWSTDGGLNWSQPADGLYSDASVRTKAGDRLLLPYYLKAGDKGVLTAPYQLIRRGERGVKTVDPGVHVAGWPRPDRPFSAKFGLAGFVFNGNTVEIADGHLAMLYGHFENAKRYSLVAAASADGVSWKIRSIVVDENCELPGAEGPCEQAVCRLKDGRLMCVFRLAGNAPYGQTFSKDDGLTWRKPEALVGTGAAKGTNIGSVQPALAALDSGPIVLTGGRPGLWAWFNANGTGQTWDRLDLLAHHNQCRPDDAIANPASGTSAYTELVALDETHALCIYDRLAGGWNAIPAGSGETNSVWVVRLTVKSR